MALTLGVLEFSAFILIQVLAIVRAWTTLNERVKVLTKNMSILQQSLKEFDKKYHLHVTEEMEHHNSQDKQISQLESKQNEHESITLVKMDNLVNDVSTLQKGITEILMKLSGLNLK